MSAAAETLTHAITIHQPYAWAICAGHKPVENRTWRPPLEMVGKLVGIHAGKTSIPEREWHKVMPVDVVERAPARVTCGALIGVARLVGVVCRAQNGGLWRVKGRSSAVGEHVPYEQRIKIDPWWRGPWGWLLGEAVLLPEPIPLRGQQGLWRLECHAPFQARCAFRCTCSEALVKQWRKARETQR